MNPLSITTGFLFALALFVRASADAPNKQTDVQTIPLDQIWGYNLPGTRDIAGIPLPDQPGVEGRTDAAYRLQREADIERLRRALVTKPPAQNAPRAFVLPRQPDWFTLRNASSRIDRKIRQPLQSEEIETEMFRVGEYMTLVHYCPAISRTMSIG